MDKENIQIAAQPPQLPMDYLPEPMKGLPQQYFTRKPDLQRSDSSDSNFTSVSQQSDKYRFLTPQYSNRINDLQRLYNRQVQYHEHLKAMSPATIKELQALKAELAVLKGE